MHSSARSIRSLQEIPASETAEMSSSIQYGQQVSAVPDSPTNEAEYDIEKNKADVDVAASAGSIDEQPFAVHDSIKRQGLLWKLSNRLGKYGVEQRGIERILPEERTQKSAWRWA